MDRKLIEYLPEWLREFREIKELTDIEQSQSENLWEALEKCGTIISLKVWMSKVVNTGRGCLEYPIRTRIHWKKDD